MPPIGRKSRNLAPAKKTTYTVFELYYTNTSNWIILVLVHWNDPQTYRSNATIQPVLVLTPWCSVFSGKVIQILLSLVWANQGLNPGSTPLESRNTYHFIIKVVCNHWKICYHCKQDELWANAHLWYPRSLANRK